MNSLSTKNQSLLRQLLTEIPVHRIKKIELFELLFNNSANPYCGIQKFASVIINKLGNQISYFLNDQKILSLFKILDLGGDQKLDVQEVGKCLDTFYIGCLDQDEATAIEIWTKITSPDKPSSKAKLVESVKQGTFLKGLKALVDRIIENIYFSQIEVEQICRMVNLEKRPEVSFYQFLRSFNRPSVQRLIQIVTRFKFSMKSSEQTTCLKTSGMKSTEKGSIFSRRGSSRDYSPFMSGRTVVEQNSPKIVLKSSLKLLQQCNNPPRPPSLSKRRYGMCRAERNRSTAPKPKVPTIKSSSDDNETEGSDALYKNQTIQLGKFNSQKSVGVEDFVVTEKVVENSGVEAAEGAAKAGRHKDSSDHLWSKVGACELDLQKENINTGWIGPMGSPAEASQAQNDSSFEQTNYETFKVAKDESKGETKPPINSSTPQSYSSILGNSNKKKRAEPSKLNASDESSVVRLKKFMKKKTTYVQQISESNSDEMIKICGPMLFKDQPLEPGPLLCNWEESCSPAEADPVIRDVKTQESDTCNIDRNPFKINLSTELQMNSENLQDACNINHKQISQIHKKTKKVNIGVIKMKNGFSFSFVPTDNLLESSSVPINLHISHETPKDFKAENEVIDSNEAFVDMKSAKTYKTESVDILETQKSEKSEKYESAEKQSKMNFETIGKQSTFDEMLSKRVTFGLCRLNCKTLSSVLRSYKKKEFTKSSFERMIKRIYNNTLQEDEERIQEAELVAEIDKFFALIDKPGKEVAEKDLIALSLIVLAKGDRYDKLEAAFKYFDLSQSGFLTQIELKKYFHSVLKLTSKSKDCLEDLGALANGISAYCFKVLKLEPQVGLGLQAFKNCAMRNFNLEVLQKTKIVDQKTKIPKHKTEISKETTVYSMNEGNWEELDLDQKYELSPEKIARHPEEVDTQYKKVIERFKVRLEELRKKINFKLVNFPTVFWLLSGIFDDGRDSEEINWREIESKFLDDSASFLEERVYDQDKLKHFFQSLFKMTQTENNFETVKFLVYHFFEIFDENKINKITNLDVAMGMFLLCGKNQPPNIFSPHLDQFSLFYQFSSHI